jgi:hypothetical protein
MTDKPTRRSRFTIGGAEGEAPGQPQAPPRRTALSAVIAATDGGDVAQVATDLGLPLLYIPTERIAPDLQQLRRLPLPDELSRLAEAGNLAMSQLIEELRELGRSIKDHGQLQPIIVYEDRDDPQFPRMTHRIIMGQRRWTGASLSNVPTLWAVVVERPTPVMRVMRQFEENERREGLSDIERAWAMRALKDALEEEAGKPVPWHVVEGYFRISPQRRSDLVRMIERFDVEGQQIISQHRWSEWTLRELHMAISAGDIAPDAATSILRELAMQSEVVPSMVVAAVEQYVAQRRAPDPASLPSDASNGSSGHGAGAPGDRGGSTGRSALAKKISAYRAGVDKLVDRVSPELEESDRQAALQEIERLMNSLESLLERLQSPAN